MVARHRPWVSLYPKGFSEDYVPRHPTAHALWVGAVAEQGEAPCVRWFDESFSYRDIDSAADALARALVARGFRRNERLAIYLQNDPQWLVALLAAWKAGGIAVPVNPMLRKRELARQLQDSGVRVLVTLAELYEREVRPVLERMRLTWVITTQEEDAACLKGRRPGRSEPPAGADALDRLIARHRDGPLLETIVQPTDVAVLSYTSGTTGPPKAAMNTHGNIAYSAQLACDWFGLGANDVVLGIAPLFHITGLVLHLAISWAARAPVILFHRFDAATCLRLAERWRATFSVGSITAYIALLREPEISTRDLSSLRKVASGGAPVSAAVVERFERATGAYVHNVYGLTETTSPSHLTPLGARSPVDANSGALSVGIPVPGAYVTVVDPETRVELPPGEVGEIAIEGPMVVPGYWENLEATEQAMPHGRLYTGDVGFMNEDGWFFVVDRLKDQINAAGYKIWPREVEDVLYEHPDVHEAAVVGVPDPYRGETVKAFVSLRPGAHATDRELIAHCRERLAAYKYPREIEFLAELPKTPTGKLLRRELRGLAGR